MKKIFFIAGIALAVISCNNERNPDNSVDPTQQEGDGRGTNMNGGSQEGGGGQGGTNQSGGMERDSLYAPRDTGNK